MIDCRTFADGHGCYDSLDCILAFIAVLAVEIDAEFIVFAFARCSYAHGRWRAGYSRTTLNVTVGAGHEYNGVAVVIAWMSTFGTADCGGDETAVIMRRPRLAGSQHVDHLPRGATVLHCSLRMRILTKTHLGKTYCTSPSKAPLLGNSSL